MPLIPVSQREGYTIEEVARHSSAKSLWVIINRKVYDVTNFHKRHPGGPAVMLQLAGKDATAAAAAAHKNALPANLMWEYCIGSLVRFKVKPQETQAPTAASPAAPKGRAKSAIRKAKPEEVLQAESSPRKAGAAASPRQAVDPNSFVSKDAGANGKAGGRKLPMMPQGPQVLRVSPKIVADGVGDGGNRMDTAETSPRVADGGSTSSPRDSSPRVTHNGPAAGEGEESLRSATQILVDMLQGCSSLEKFASVTSRDSLEKHVRTFLGAAFDGNEWPVVSVTRGMVEIHFPELEGAVWDALQGPLPLGEDTMLAAVDRLAPADGDPAERDPRVTRFFESVRDLLFFGVARRRNSTNNARVLMAVLEGSWVTSDGHTCIVNGDQVRFDDKVDFKIQTTGQTIQLNGWTAQTFGAKNVHWSKGVKTMDWARASQGLPAAPARSASAPAAVRGNAKAAPPKKSADDPAGAAAAIAVPNGIWVNVQDVMCTVHQDVCTFVTKGPYPITRDEQGASMVNGWRAVSASTSSVEWAKASQSMRWRRLSSAKEVTALEGTWRNTSGLICTVKDGQCHFIPKGSPPLQLGEDGLLLLNGWVATAIMEDQVDWIRNGVSMRWDRMPESVLA